MGKVARLVLISTKYGTMADRRMTSTTSRQSDAGGPRTPGRSARAERGREKPRRRTLGLCAHCHRPVELHEEHVRLYRLAWHVDCALAAGDPQAPLPPNPAA